MVDGFWEETIVANGFLKDFYYSTIVVNYFVKFEPLVSMVFDHRTIAIESMVLQSTIGDDGFSMVNEKTSSQSSVDAIDSWIANSWIAQFTNTARRVSQNCKMSKTSATGPTVPTVSTVPTVPTVSIVPTVQ